MCLENDSTAPGLSQEDNRLKDLGWSDHFARHFQPYAEQGLEAGRIVLQQQHRYAVRTAAGELDAEVAGRLLHDAVGPGDLPAVGDWVALDPSSGRDHTAIIHAVLSRRTKLSRKVAGRRAEEQIVAANIDTVFLVMGLDGDFNLRRLERLLVAAWESGARPVVVLSKADLAEDDVADRRLAVEATAPGVDVRVTSSVSGLGLDAIGSFLAPGETVALIGSSGVGKSSLINGLLGHEVLRTGAVRSGDDRGRHTTTHRELVALPDGALLIDNPGIRELVPWSGEDGLGGAFEDIQTLATGCRFRDCTHSGEPGCEVSESVAEGRLDAGRLRNYHDLERELRALDLRRDKAAQRVAGKKAQAMFRSAKKAKQQRYRR